MKNAPSLLALVTIVLAAAWPGCLAPASGPAADRPALAERWGIELTGIHPSAAGTVIDLRYRILDAEKALPVADGRHEAYLVHRASGKVLGVPKPAKVGALRQTTRGARPQVGRVYFVLFGNPGHLVRPGDRVDLVIGDLRVENLLVE